MDEIVSSEKVLLRPEILIVDDALEQLELIKDILVDEGYKLRLANSGELALSSIQIKKPDLILLDVQMPGLDGYEVCKQLKLNEATQDIPVIFLSALTGVKDKICGFEAGGIDYITKPYNSLEVLERIKSHLRLFYIRQRLTSENKDLELQVQEQKKQQTALFAESEVLRTTFLSIGDGLICTDQVGKIILINEVAKNLTGWYGQSAFGNDFYEVCHLIDSDTRMRIPNPIPSVIQTGKIFYLARQICLVSRDGIERLVTDSIAPIRGANQDIIGAVMVFRDSIDEKLRQSELHNIIYTDQLTGLHNRRYFEEEIIYMNRAEYLPLSIVIADINGLKMINDAFGHSTGDILLRRASQVLNQFKKTDDYVCRYGGDEFVVMLSHTSSQEAENYTKAIAKTLENYQNTKEYFTMAFGWETMTRSDENMFDVLKKSEDNMFKNKLMESPSVRHLMIQTIMNTLYEKSPREKAHSERVSEVVQELGKAMNLSTMDMNSLKMAGLLHDIGKTIIPDHILNKPGRLSPLECEEMKKHSEIGYRILRNIPELLEIANIILQHHERWDGKGYPKGLSGEEINISARMIAVADAYDAMTSERPYKNKMTFEEAIETIKANAGSHFDPEIAEIFIKCIESNY